MDNEIHDTLRKMAMGYFEQEHEEVDGKQKTKSKYFPPRIEAIRELMTRKPQTNRFEFMTKDELIFEIEKILNELRENL